MWTLYKESKMFRRRHRLGCRGKLIIATMLCILVYFSFRKNKKTTEMRQSIRTETYKNSVIEAFYGMFDLTVSQKCLSSVKAMKISANYTVNNVLDSDEFQAVLKSTGYIITNEHAQIDGPSVPDSELLEVIVIPHSHNDPGWLKTYQKYYDDQTSHILTNMVEKLHQYPDMTFVWVESCFLDKWWKTQSQETKDKLKTLVQSGRLEITSGMWVAPDEASTHYFALLDQMIEGHYWIKRNLGVVPESSLNFDQFGYSATMPYLVKKAGIKNVLIKRIHRGLKHLFGHQRKMNFKWRQFWDPDGKDDIFGHIDTYEFMSISDSCGPSKDVCNRLDFQRQPDIAMPSMDGLASALVDQFQKKNENYRYKVMMMPHGGDFRFDTVDEWDRQYKNLKMFMNYVNDNKQKFNVHIRFGTLKDYFIEVEKQTKKYGLTFPVMSGDFYSYTEHSDFWVGYFTTRQFDKRLSREVLESLRAAELMTAFALRDSRSRPLDENMQSKVLSSLSSARKSLGVFQHHDAITGTSKADVVVDYEQLLSSAFESLQDVLRIVCEHLIVGTNGKFEGKFKPVLRRTEYNQLTQEVTIPASNSGTQIILVNYFTQSRTELVTLTLETGNIDLIDPKGERIKFDITPLTEKSVEISFQVSFPPLSLLIFTVKTNRNSQSSGQTIEKIEKEKVQSEHFFCNNSFMNVSFVKDGGTQVEVCYKSSDFCTQMKLDWRHYKGTGGAYSMISHGQEVPACNDGARIKFVKGQNYCGIEGSFDYFSFTISLVLTNSVAGRALKVDILSDLSRKKDFLGDLAMRIETSVKSGKMFYVDSNAFQMMGRKFRDSLSFDGNVYPMTAMSVLQDEKLRLVVHSAQPHGVVSRSSGIIEFMLDRIAPKSEMGLPEGVRDSKPTKTFFFVEFQSSIEFEHTDTTETAIPSINSIFLNDIMQHPIFKFYSTESIEPISNPLTLLAQTLPCDVILANVKNLVGDSSQRDGISLTLFRRAVSCGKKIEDNLCPLFETASIQPGSLVGKHDDVTEVYLSHLMPKRKIGRYESVSLDPMELKTFLLK